MAQPGGHAQKKEAKEKGTIGRPTVRIFVIYLKVCLLKTLCTSYLPNLSEAQTGFCAVVPHCFTEG